MSVHMYNYVHAYMCVPYLLEKASFDYSPQIWACETLSGGPAMQGPKAFKHQRPVM